MAGSVAEDMPAQTPEPRQKKVRLACQRCRDRRIKCDGQTPSCSKCAKAGVACIDVDARNAQHNIPRAFMSDAQARLDWLEDIVRSRLPDVDLSTGPNRPDLGSHGDSSASPGPSNGPKRPYDATSGDGMSSMSRKARRMALELGLFSLNTNVSQAHYLGSSSGSCFANLLPKGDHGDAGDVGSEPESDNEPPTMETRPPSSTSSQALFLTLQDMLPPRTDCDRMVKLFYNFYHADYPVLHQPSFASLVDGLYACAQTDPASKVQHNGWPESVAVFRYNGAVAIANGKESIAISIRTAAAQLFFVLSIAADLQTRKRCFTSDPGKFRSQALALFQISLSEVSIASIQTMLLFVLQNFLTPEGGSIWIILHIAFAYAIDLGIHRHRSIELEATMKRRTFFCLYVLERFVSTVQGRPLGFPDETLDLTMPGVQESDRNSSSFFAYSIEHFKWATLLSEIKSRLYRFIPHGNVQVAATQIQREIHTRLDLWLDESTAIVNTLPENVRHRFHAKLQIDYYFAVGLLYQPSQLCPRPDDDALRRCFDSATHRVRLFWSLYTQSNLSLSWPTTHGIFLAGATLIYCIWSSPTIRSTITVAETSADLRLCSSLLMLGGEWWPLAQRGRRSFEKLADAIVKSLAKTSSEQQQRNLPAISMEPIFPANQAQWLDVESTLQAFLQNDSQLTDMLDAIDASPFGPMGPDWDLSIDFNAPLG